MAHGPSLLQSLWNEMDSATDPLMQASETGQGPKPYEAGRARGLAYALSLFMVPHFTTEDDIVSEAIKRWQKKQASEPYETPGLGSRIYEPPPGDNKYNQGPTQSKTGRTPDKDAWMDKLAADVKEVIKTSTFPADILSKIYGLTEAQIKQIQAA